MPKVSKKRSSNSLIRMNLVDEEHVILVKITDDWGEITRSFDRRPGGDAQVDPQPLSKGRSSAVWRTRRTLAKLMRRTYGPEGLDVWISNSTLGCVPPRARSVSLSCGAPCELVERLPRPCRRKRDYLRYGIADPTNLKIVDHTMTCALNKGGDRGHRRGEPGNLYPDNLEFVSDNDGPQHS